MKVGIKWFTTGMGLGIILCTVAIAPAAEREKMIAVGGNDGMLHKTNDIGSAPQSGVRNETPQRLQGRPEETAADIDMTDDQDPLDSVVPGLDHGNQTGRSARAPAGEQGRALVSVPNP